MPRGAPLHRVRERISVENGPGQVCTGAVAGAGEERADLLECEPSATGRRGHRRSRGSGSRCDCVDGGYGERDEPRDGGNKG